MTALPKNPEISIIIGFKDWGLDRLSGAVRSVQNSLKGINSEIIISDYGSSSTEGYREALEQLGAIYRYVETDGVWSRSRALNAGLQIASGEFLVTTDADMVFSESTFPKILELLKADPFASYLLQCRDLPEGIDHSHIFDGSVDWNAIENASRLRPRWGMGGMIAFSRYAYELTRGLDERMQIYGGEDIDLAKRLLRIGYKRVWIQDPAVRMYHVWHPSSRALADDSEEGRQAIARNRDIHLNDPSVIRNLKEWNGRPLGAPPLVTVAISTYNRAEYLTDSINSVLGQTFKDWELIVVNDGSTDNTLEVLSSFNDPRIRIISQENKGLACARNRITVEARGKYIAVHDDDDIMLPWSLEVRLQAISNGAHGSYGGWVDYDNRTGQRFYNSGKKLSIESLLFNRSTYLHPTLLVEKAVLKAIPYDDTMRSGSDFNLAVRMVRAGIKLNHSTQYVLLRRLHEGQITNSDSALQKVSGFVTNFMARGTMTPSDIATMREDRHEKDKVAVPFNQDEADSFVVPFMPDHLVRRSADISLELTQENSQFEQYDYPISSFWISEDERSVEVNVHLDNVPLSDLFELHKNHGEALAVYATEVTHLEDQAQERREKTRFTESHIAGPFQGLENWLVSRLNNSPSGVYLAVQCTAKHALESLAIDEIDFSANINRNLCGIKDDFKIYRLNSIERAFTFLSEIKNCNEVFSAKPKHFILVKGK